MRRIIARTLRECFRAAPAMSVTLVLTMVIAGLQPLLTLPLSARLIDALRYVVAGDWRPVISAVLLLSIVVFVGTTAMFAANTLTLRIRMTLGITINEQMMQRAAATPLLDLETPAFHDRLQRAMQARLSLFSAVTSMSAMIRTVFAVVSILSVLARLHWAAVLLILAGVVPTWFIQARSAAEANAMRRRQAPWLRRVGYLASLLTGRPFAQEVRLFGLSGYAEELYTAQMQQITTDRIAVTTRQSCLQVAARTSGNLAYVGSLALLGARALAGAISAGQFGVMISGLQQVQSAGAAVMDLLGNLQKDLPAAGDIYDFIDDVPMGGSRPAGAHLPVAAPVVFDDVTFSYPGTTGETLQAISFQIAPGELVAIVGENGAGKSTLVKLLLGLYRPMRGRVTVDGLEVGAPEAEALRPRLAAVFQDFQRYALRAGENIAVADVGALADRPRIERAAAGSGADEVIAGLADGYDTRLRREFYGGVDLSGGQWQKLAIARAYMRQASVMVLDEPTAALDPEAELQVFRQFHELVQGKTGFFISHRLGPARLADRILVLKQGRLVESGRHAELMARDGEYAALFRAQAHWYTA